jgi:hypothetical protein
VCTVQCAGYAQGVYRRPNLFHSRSRLLSLYWVLYVQYSIVSIVVTQPLTSHLSRSFFLVYSACILWPNAKVLSSNLVYSNLHVAVYGSLDACDIIHYFC